MKTQLLIIASLAVALVAAPAMAEIYTVKLSNGTEFDTQRRPKEASFDDTKVLILTDVGNWIAVNRADIISVTAETERAGFGKVIDTHTVALGWAPNDAPVEDPDASLDPMTQLIDYLSNQEQPNYDVNQFVDPSQAGQGGLPVWGVGGGGVLNDTVFPVDSGGARANQPSVVDQ
jgi:hypothetical protein